jgi:hypothetical protein
LHKTLKGSDNIFVWIISHIDSISTINVENSRIIDNSFYFEDSHHYQTFAYINSSYFFIIVVFKLDNNYELNYELVFYADVDLIFIPSVCNFGIALINEKVSGQVNKYVFWKLVNRLA